MARKSQSFNARVTSSGSSGVALYIPSHIVKATGLDEMVNRKVTCTLDEDGDIIVDLEEAYDE